VFDPPAAQVELDTAERRDTEVAALTDNLGAQLICIDTHQVVGTVADVRVGFRFGLDVGSIPPLNNRSTGARRIARIRVGGAIA